MENNENQKWTEKGGIIYFIVTSDGTTGEQWITRLKSSIFCLDDRTKNVLLSKNFEPISSGVTYKIAVLKGEIFSDNKRITENIREDARNRGFVTPNPEIACLIREKFSDEELEDMGLIWIVVMHNPIEDSDGDPGLLGAYRALIGPWLGAACDYPDIKWKRSSCFAFVVSQSPVSEEKS